MRCCRFVNIQKICLCSFATRNGIVKKTPLKAYSNQRANGIWAINLDEDDELVNVEIARVTVRSCFSPVPVSAFDLRKAT